MKNSEQKCKRCGKELSQEEQENRKKYCENCLGKRGIKFRNIAIGVGALVAGGVAYLVRKGNKK